MKLQMERFIIIIIYFRQKCLIPSMKYGADLVRFIHGKQSVLYASKNGWDDSIRFLDFQVNKFLRYFKGHRDQYL